MVKHNSVLDNLFAALCDPTRRSILQMLRDRRTHLFHLEAGTLQSAFEWLKTYQSFWDLQLTSLENYLNKISKKMGE
jgi:hypothetical protein